MEEAEHIFSFFLNPYFLFGVFTIIFLAMIIMYYALEYDAKQIEKDNEE